METLLDTEYHWQGFGNGNGRWDSFCRMRIIRAHELVVVATDLGNDTGTSITNCAEYLATLFTRDFEDYGMDENTLWIHHYQYLPGTRDFPESFDLVKFEHHKASGRTNYGNAEIIFKKPEWECIIEGFEMQSTYQKRTGQKFRYEVGKLEYQHLANICASLMNPAPILN